MDGCSSAASALESARGPLRSNAVNGSYFHPVTVKSGRDRMTISWSSDPVKAKSNCILTDKMMCVCLSRGAELLICWNFTDSLSCFTCLYVKFLICILAMNNAVPMVWLGLGTKNTLVRVRKWSFCAENTFKHLEMSQVWLNIPGFVATDSWRCSDYLSQQICCFVVTNTAGNCLYWISATQWYQKSNILSVDIVSYYSLKKGKHKNIKRRKY